MLEIRSVAKRFGSFEMCDVDLRIEQGEYFILLGPSGIGKTVLIETIAGIIKPDAGAILWQGRDITHCPPEARGFAVVYQDCALFPHITVEKNIAYGLKSGKGHTNVRGIAKSLGIEHLLSRYPEKLSGGEQQRVALARALITEPQLLLLDEPLSALDRVTRRQLRNELKRVNAETGITCLHVTHDMDEAMSLGERIGVMLDGRIHQVDTPVELFRSPSDPQVAEFLGMRNVIPVTEVKDGVCKAFGMDIHAGTADESTSYIWVKPEEILLSKTPFESSARNQFKCTVQGWEPAGPLLAIGISICDLRLSVLITHASFADLEIEAGKALYATFKSSAVHCF